MTKKLDLELETTSLRLISSILIRFKDIMNNPVEFFTDTGNLIMLQNTLQDKNWYLVLGAFQLEEKFKQMENMWLDKHLKLAQKRLFYQTKNNMKDYHFGTSGSIFSLGYGPMYTQNHVIKHFIDMFSINK